MDKKLEIMKKIVLGTLLCLMFNQCEKIKYMNEKKFDWIVYTTADAGYPMKIVDGWFTYENGDYTSIPNMLTRAGLLRDSGTMLIGEDYRPVPVEMEIYWFSPVENKFFKGKFKLDKEKMIQLFEKSKSIGSKGDLKVAPIPGGRVILYYYAFSRVILGVYQGEEYVVKGDEAFRKEIGTTSVSTLTRSEFIDDDYPQHVQEEIKSGKINYQLWDNILKKYPWRFRIEYDVPLYMVYNEMGLAGFIDGTNYGHKEDIELITSYHPKPVPYDIGDHFNTRPDGSGMEMVYRLYIGNVSGKNYYYQDLEYEDMRKREQELMKLFADFYEKIGRTEFEVVLKLKDKFIPKGVYLKKGNIEQLIPDVYIEAYNDTFNKILLEGVPKQ